ncbi:MAG: hypothetical protein U9Q99_00535 [Nanoarchaeota archaeon]|nr:hypothetical protein [Nanoarchaeota archaeon]
MAKYVKPIVHIPINPLFILEGVKIRKEYKTFEIYEMFNAMDNNFLAKLSMEEKEKGNPYAISSIENWAILNAGARTGNEKLTKQFQHWLQKWPQTLSRVQYNPKGIEDKIIHNYLMDNQEILTTLSFVGKDDWIKDIKDKSNLKLLTGSNNTTYLNETSQKINDTYNYIFRLNEEPQEKDEKIVEFDVISGCFILGACGDPSGMQPAFRVREI